MAPGSLFIPNAAHRDVLKVLAKLRGASHHLFSAIQRARARPPRKAELVQPSTAAPRPTGALAQLLERHVQAVHLRLPPADLLTEGGQGGDREGAGDGASRPRLPGQSSEPLPPLQGQNMFSERSGRAESPPRLLHAELCFLQVRRQPTQHLHLGAQENSASLSLISSSLPLTPLCPFSKLQSTPGPSSDFGGTPDPLLGSQPTPPHPTQDLQAQGDRGQALHLCLGSHPAGPSLLVLAPTWPQRAT